MEKTPSCILVALVLTSFGCEVLGLNGPVHDDTAAGRIIMIDEATGLAALPADAAEVEEVALRGSTLVLKVRYAGGCAEHEFELYGGSAFVKTNPPGGEVWLAHDANGDLCEALLTKELTFDLLPLERAYRRIFRDRGSFLVNVHEPTGQDGAFEHVSSPSPLYRL